MITENYIIKKIPEGYKQTEVGVIPEDWNLVELKKAINSTQLGGNYPNSESESNFPLIKMGNIGRGNINLNKIEYVLVNEIPKEKDHLHYGDVLFNTRNTLDLVGKVAIWRNELPIAYYNSNLMRMKFKNDFVSSSFYINYLFNSSQSLSQLKGFATGTTSVAAIYTRDLLKYKLVLPKLFEQKAIATVLSDTDALIEKMEKLIIKKKAIKQGTMQQLLTGKKRLPGFSGEWKVKKLGEIAEIKKGQLITDRTRINGSIPVIAGGKALAYYHNKANRRGKTITVSGSGANAGYVAFHTKPIFASDCSTIEESKIYSIEFIYFLLQSLQEKIYKMQTGGAQPHIHPSDLNPIIVAVPKLEEQTAIANILSDMDAEIESLEQKRDKYTMLKQGMMQQLLTGRIRIYANN